MSRDSVDTHPPRSESQPSGTGWWAAVRRSAKGLKADQLTDRAAALTYYGVLSLFPALLAAVSILGLFGTQALTPLIENLSTLAPGAVRDLLIQALRNLESSQGGALLFTLIGIALALWSASGYVAAFTRASNVIYGIPEGRPIWKLLPLRLVVTMVLVVLLALSATIVVFTGDLARRAGDLVGLGDTAVTVWNIAKWPVLLLAVILMLAILYRTTPNVRHPGLGWITPGSAVAVLLWLIFSAGFALYVANFGSYNQTYGAVAGVIIFLIWLWLSNLAIMFGVELDSELVRGRAIATGHPPAEEPYVEPRDTRKFPDKFG